MSVVTADSTGGVTIGVDKAHYALLLSDKAGEAPEYSDVKPLPNTKSIVVSSNDNAQTEYYDNDPTITAMSKGEKKVVFTKSDFSNANQRDLLGHQLSDGGITIEGGDSIPPYAGFAYRTLKSNGHYRLTWLPKGMFSIGEVSSATREQNVAFQNQSINGTFITRKCDNQIKLQIDTDDPEYTEEIGENWFKVETLKKLYKVAVKPAAPPTEPEEDE